MKKREFHDNEEKELVHAYKREEFKPVKNQKAAKQTAAETARRYMRKDARINIRLSSADLEMLKRRAAEEGLPYQSLIASILHKYVSGRSASVAKDTEIIDPRSLQPFDTATVVDSVKKTHRAMIVHEAVRFGGLGAEIAAQIQEHAFDYLDAPVARIGAPFSPVPFSPALEAHYVPNADRIVAEAKELLGL